MLLHFHSFISHFENSYLVTPSLLKILAAYFQSLCFMFPNQLELNCLVLPKMSRIETLIAISTKY